MAGCESKATRPLERLTAAARQGSRRRMKIRPACAILVAATVASPAFAIVGGGSAAPDLLARSVVTVVGSRGNFCTGALIAPDLVLTAAHCVAPGASYKIVDYSGKPAKLLDVRNVAVHPSFSLPT